MWVARSWLNYLMILNGLRSDRVICTDLSFFVVILRPCLRSWAQVAASALKARPSEFKGWRQEGDEGRSCAPGFVPCKCHESSTILVFLCFDKPAGRGTAEGLPYVVIEVFYSLTSTCYARRSEVVSILCFAFGS